MRVCCWRDHCIQLILNTNETKTRIHAAIVENTLLIQVLHNYLCISELIDEIIFCLPSKSILAS